MPGNTNPLFSRIARTAFNVTSISAANTSTLGGTLGTNIFVLGTSDATNGSYIRGVRFIACASVAGSTTTATTGRVWLSTVSSGALTVANSIMYDDVALTGSPAANATAVSGVFDVNFGFGLAPGITVSVSCHAAPAANTEWRAIALLGDW